MSQMPSLTFFDAVLCDAPCSGEGMFRKSDDAVNDWSIANVQKCAALQKEILENAYRCLETRWELWYTAPVLSQKKKMKRIWYGSSRNTLIWKLYDRMFPLAERAFDLGCGTENALRIFPMDGGEGHFICKLHKQGNAGSDSAASERKQNPYPKKCQWQALHEILKEPYPYMYLKNSRIYGGIGAFL
jgi:16S rRNA C967 or C1407 C5-methylase (RsmB/RsmF family)